MKTTLNIDDKLMAKLRKEAARRGPSISELVDAALRRFLSPVKQSGPLPPIPTFDSGGAYIDVANRESLEDLKRKR